MFVIFCNGPSKPVLETVRHKSNPPSASFLPIQLTTASPFSRTSMSTLPIGRSASIVTGVLKEAPSLSERAMRTRGAEFASEYQATITVPLCAAMAGPLTGQPPIRQLS